MNSISIKNSLFETYQYREVLYRILSRDLKIKYKRTFLGYFWSLLNPILQLTILTVVFSHAMRFPMKDYTLYLFSGLIGWTFFQSSLVMSATSIIENENFIKKIYIPKFLFPLSRLLMRFIDFGFALVALTLLGAVLGFELKGTLVYLPLALFSLVLFTLGASVIAAVATVFFRDVEYLLSVFLQLFYFMTPILYPVEVIPEQYRWLIEINPFYTQLLLFQKLIYFGIVPSAAEWGTAFLSSAFVFALGVGLLTKLEDELVFRL